VIPMKGAKTVSIASLMMRVAQAVPAPVAAMPRRARHAAGPSARCRRAGRDGAV